MSQTSSSRSITALWRTRKLSHLSNCGFVLAKQVCFTSVLSLGSIFSTVLTNRTQKLHSDEACTWASDAKRGSRWANHLGPLALNGMFFSLKVPTATVYWRSQSPRLPEGPRSGSTEATSPASRSFCRARIPCISQMVSRKHGGENGS